MKYSVTEPKTRALSKWLCFCSTIVFAILSIGCEQLASTVPGADVPHDKLAMVSSGSWESGEYKECQSNISKEDEPFLDCGGYVGSAQPRRFKVTFHGPIDKDGLWDCRKNSDDDLKFSCWQKAQDKPTTEGRAQSTPAQTPVEGRQLTAEEIEYYRKRNECEFRFMDKGIYQVKGEAVGAACKENPNLRP